MNYAEKVAKMANKTQQKEYLEILNDLRKVMEYLSPKDYDKYLEERKTRQKLYYEVHSSIVYHTYIYIYIYIGTSDERDKKWRRIIIPKSSLLCVIFL